MVDRHANGCKLIEMNLIDVPTRIALFVGQAK